LNVSLINKKRVETDHVTYVTYRIRLLSVKKFILKVDVDYNYARLMGAYSLHISESVLSP